MSELLLQVYYITKANLKTADKRYSTVDNDYEMTFNSETQMTLCTENVELPNVTFNFVPINQLEGHQPNTVVGTCCLTLDMLDYCKEHLVCLPFMISVLVNAKFMRTALLVGIWDA